LSGIIIIILFFIFFERLEPASLFCVLNPHQRASIQRKKCVSPTGGGFVLLNVLGMHLSSWCECVRVTRSHPSIRICQWKKQGHIQVV